MTNYLTYTYLLTPLHTGSSSQAGNVLGIAREAQTELPYLPSSSIRGKIRSFLETNYSKYDSEIGTFFGEKIKDGSQPTEGEVWFADATLLLFPVASFSHQFLWITCPLWLSRWNRWLNDSNLAELITHSKTILGQEDKKVLANVSGKQIYLQGAIVNESNIVKIDSKYQDCFKSIPDGNGILELDKKLVILSNDDCGSLVEIGLQREVRITLDDNKSVAQGSFRAEEAIPSETVLFFPWGVKPNKDETKTTNARTALNKTLNSRLQFGGLEGLGRGWTDNKTVSVTH